MVELAAGETIATSDILTDFDLRVLWMISSHIGFGNKVKISQAEIARRLRSDPAQISRSVARLVSADVLIKTSARAYELNRIVGTMGARKKSHPFQVIDGDGQS